MKLELRYPATIENAAEHAALAVVLLREQRGLGLDWTPASLEDVDRELEAFREEGIDGEEMAEVLFALGCYVGGVLVKWLGGRLRPTAESPLRGISPWPWVVAFPDGSCWDVIGRVFKRLELGDSESLSSFYGAIAARSAADA